MSGVSASEMSRPIKLSLHVTASNRPPRPTKKGGKKGKTTLTDSQLECRSTRQLFDTEHDEAVISSLKLAS